jgi:hypothetical protein
MSNIGLPNQCPSCHGDLKPKVLACVDCDVKVEGDFHLNEFATLQPEDLHFLRIFVQCEGRVRDMETALGLSYPTIRTRITDLKTRILARQPEDSKTKAKEQTIQSVLERLERKEIPFEEAMKTIRKIKGQKS